MSDTQQYNRLVRRLERQSHADPAAFRRRVVFVSLAAYAAIIGVLAVALLLVWLLVHLALSAQLGVLTVKVALLGLLPLALLFLVLRTLFTRIPAPEGREVTRDEAPALFDTLDRMQAKLRGPRIDHVFIDDRYNASIAQRPRFGLFGWHVNYLTIGLPYLLGVPMKEMLATVAHEYGHLCGNHGKLGAWVYRQRQVFVTLYGQVREEARDSLYQRAVAAVLDRLMPYYNAYTFVLSRQNEFDADRTASALVGTVANAQGLVRDALQSRWMDEQFWPTLLRHAEKTPRPPFMPFAAMRTAFKAGYEEWAQPDALAQALAVDSSAHDTHPCLRERVEATGERAALPRPVDRAAAEVLLTQEFLRALIREFDEAWWARASRDWEARHRHASRERLRLLELGQRALAELSLADLQELALLRIEYVSLAAGREVLAYLLAQPGGPFPTASYHYGRILLAEDNDQGLFHLEVAAANDRALVDAAVDAGQRFLQRTRSGRAAQQWANGLLPRVA